MQKEDYIHSACLKSNNSSGTSKIMSTYSQYLASSEKGSITKCHFPVIGCCYGRRLYGWHSTAIEKNSNSILKRMKRTSHDVHTKPTILVYIKMALTKASASKGWRSSTPSPTPTNFTGIPSSSTTLTCKHKLVLPIMKKYSVQKLLNIH